MDDAENVNGLADAVARYRRDPESVYHTWFLNDAARLKAFRSIRRGVQGGGAGVRAGTFPNDYKGSPLETVLESITGYPASIEVASGPICVGGRRRTTYLPLRTTIAFSTKRAQPRPDVKVLERAG